MPFHVLPVIHAGALELGITELKPQGLDQVEHGVRRRAEPGHVPSVGRDFRFDQDDVHGALRGR